MTPNLRLRHQRCASADQNAEPPPSPTHHAQTRRPHQRQELESRARLEEFLCVEWNGQSERIVLSQAGRCPRSMSAGNVSECVVRPSWSFASDKKLKDSVAVRSQRVSSKRKSRSLDSSPVRYSDRPVLGVRSSWATNIQVRPTKNEKRNSLKPRIANGNGGGGGGSCNSNGNEVNQSQGGVKEKEKRFALARLSPLFGRKTLLANNSTGAEPKQQKDRQNQANHQHHQRQYQSRGCSEPNTPNASPLVGRRRNHTKTERSHSPIR